MSTVAYPKQEGNISSVVIIYSANTPKYTNIPGVMINPVLSAEVKNAPANYLKIVDSVIVLKTQAEIDAMDTRTASEKREKAYATECDPYLPVLQSYELESDPRLATVKAEWEAKRLAIQQKYPDTE